MDYGFFIHEFLCWVFNSSSIDTHIIKSKDIDRKKITRTIDYVAKIGGKEINEETLYDYPGVAIPTKKTPAQIFEYKDIEHIRPLSLIKDILRRNPEILIEKIEFTHKKFDPKTYQNYQKLDWIKFLEEKLSKFKKSKSHQLIPVLYATEAGIFSHDFDLIKDIPDEWDQKCTEKHETIYSKLTSDTFTHELINFLNELKEKENYLVYKGSPYNLKLMSRKIHALRYTEKEDSFLHIFTKKLKIKWYGQPHILALLIYKLHSIKTKKGLLVLNVNSGKGYMKCAEKFFSDFSVEGEEKKMNLNDILYKTKKNKEMYENANGIVTKLIEEY